jgi:hypothetical protein
MMKMPTPQAVVKIFLLDNQVMCADAFPAKTAAHLNPPE